MSARIDSSRVLTAGAIRAWLETDTKRFKGPSVEDAWRWASEQWSKYSEPPSATQDLEPDRLHALARIVRDDPDAKPERVAAWYAAAERVCWRPDVFDEKFDLLSQFSYCTWRQYRRAGDAASAWTWEEKVVGLTLKRPSIPEFLSLPEAQHSDQICLRFLTDPSLLLTLCRQLADLVNNSPVEALRRATLLYRFLSNAQGPVGSRDERSYFRANLALIRAIAEKECGRYDECSQWLAEAEKDCQFVAGPAIIHARIAFVRKALAFQLRAYRDSLSGLPELRERFRRYGVLRYVARCYLLEGMALKELGRDSEALPRCLEAASSTAPEVETWFKGLALIHAAEIHGRNGNDLLACDALGTAWPLVKDSRVPPTIAHFHGVKAEILRDRGLLDAAIQSYRLSVAAYASAGMVAFEAYLRVLLSETLLAAGRDRDAVLEIVTALPVIERLGLLHEGVAAIALLRESLSREKADPVALGTLKRQLQQFSKEGRA